MKSALGQTIRRSRWRPSPYSHDVMVSSSSSSRKTTTTAVKKNTAVVNDDEVQKFSALSDGWWDPAQNPLISMNVVRVQYMKNMIQKHILSTTTKRRQNQDDSSSLQPLHGLTALDIGCGGGLLSESLVRLGAKSVTGLDPSSHLLEAARQHAATHLTAIQQSRLEYRNATVEEYCNDNKKKEKQLQQEELLFDIVCCLEVMEHVPDPANLLQAATRLLKPGTGEGLLFVSTINKTRKSWLATILGAEYLLRALPIGTHQWSAYQSPHDVRQMMLATALQQESNNKMRQVDVTGMVIASCSLPFVLMRNEWNWQLDPNDTDVNWIGCYQKAGEE